MAKRRLWTKEELEFLRDNWGYLTIKEIAKKLNRNSETVRLKAKSLGIKNVVQQEYAVYYDDEFQFTGTAKECAEKLKITINTFNFMKSPVYRRRTETGIFIVDLGKWRKDE